MSVPVVSIVVRCLNEEAHIGRLLDGIAQQSVSNVETIIVDSGSTDATLSIASRYPTKILHIRKEEFSFGAALNIGCDAASGQCIVVASAHVYPVYHDWIERLVSHFDHGRVGLVYGKQRGNQQTKFSEHQVFSKWFPEESDVNQTSPFCNNANVAIRRSLWASNRYDETLTGLEDLAWARRVQEAGHRIVYDADAEVIHVHDETLGALYSRYRREAIAMKAIFPHESFGLISVVRMVVGNVYRDCRVAAAHGVLRANWNSILGFRLGQFLGTWRGYAQRGAVTRELKNRFYYPQSEILASGRERRVRDARAIDYGDDMAEGKHD